MIGDSYSATIGVSQHTASKVARKTHRELPRNRPSVWLSHSVILYNTDVSV